MKFYLTAAVLFLLLACSSEEKIQTPKTTAVMVFVDKTSSVNLADDYVGNKYKTALKQLIDDNIHHTGDELEMYYIHENTSKARCLTLKARAAMEDTYGMNATDLEAAKTSFDLMLQKEKAIFTRSAMEKMLQQNDGASNRETDILASIKLINEKCAEFDFVKVYFFSDMIESKINGRDFHKNPPKSSSEADDFIKADTKSMADAMLSNAEINVLLPFEPTSSTAVNNPNISAYWQSLFEKFGANYQEL